MFCVDGEEHTRLNRLCDLDKLFPPSWKAPSSLLEALQQAGIPDSEEVSVACEEIGESVCSRATTGSGVSKEDAAVIACYTFDFGPAAYEFVSHRNLHFFQFLLISSDFFISSSQSPSHMLMFIDMNQESFQNFEHCTV